MYNERLVLLVAEFGGSSKNYVAEGTVSSLHGIFPKKHFDVSAYCCLSLGDSRDALGGKHMVRYPDLMTHQACDV